MAGISTVIDSDQKEQQTQAIAASVSALLKATSNQDEKSKKTKVSKKNNALINKKEEKSNLPIIGFVPEKTKKPKQKNMQSSYTTSSVKERLFFQALEAQKTNNINKAIKLYYSVLDLDSNHDQARLILASLLVQDQQYATAIAQLTQLVKPSNKDWRPWFWQGTALLMLGKLDQAASSLDEALQRESSRTSLWVQRALVEQERGSHRTALQLLAVAEQIEPDNAQVLINTAYSTEALADHENAIKTYRHFLSSNTENTASHKARHTVMSHLVKLTSRQ